MEGTDSIKGQNALTDDEAEKNNRAKIDYNYVTDEKNGNKLSSGGSEINKQELTNESSEKSKYKWLLIGAIIITCNVMIILLAVYGITNRINNTQGESNNIGNIGETIAQTAIEETTIAETTVAQTTVQETTSQQPVTTTVPATTKEKKKKAKNTTTTKASSNSSSGSSSKKSNDDDFNFKNVVE